MKRSYQTDLTDAEWEAIEPHIPAANKRGRPRIHGSREILNAVFFYVLRSGCPWRLLPKDFPPWETLYSWFRKWRTDGTFERLNASLRDRLRTRLGRNPLPSAGIADSQSAKRAPGLVANREDTTATRRSGAQRGICWWTRRVWCSKPCGAQRQGARAGRAEAPLLESARSGLSRLKHLWLEAGYEGSGRRWAEEQMGLSVDVVRKPPKPIPEEVAKLWAEEWAKEGKKID